MTELEGVTILVVEDDDDTREVLKVMLEMCGARVLCAGSARAGLHTFHAGASAGDRQRYRDARRGWLLADR